MKKIFLAIAIAAMGFGSLQAQNGSAAKPVAKPATATTTAKPAPAKEKPAAKPATEAKPAAAPAEVHQMKKDGTPDKRYASNRHLKKDGTPDKRHKEHKKSGNDDMKAAPKSDKK
jgi:hypothetical protein